MFFSQFGNFFSELMSFFLSRMPQCLKEYSHVCDRCLSSIIWRTEMNLEICFTLRFLELHIHQKERCELSVCLCIVASVKITDLLPYTKICKQKVCCEWQKCAAYAWTKQTRQLLLQRVQCSHCKRCIGYSNFARPSVRLSVCLSVCPSHAGIVSKRRHVARCSLHRWIAKCV